MSLFRMCCHDRGVIGQYCFNDLESNCGGQWGESYKGRFLAGKKKIQVVKHLLNMNRRSSKIDYVLP